jgi:hypothetical protein
MTEALLLVHEQCECLFSRKTGFARNILVIGHELAYKLMTLCSCPVKREVQILFILSWHDIALHISACVWSNNMAELSNETGRTPYETRRSSFANLARSS